MNLGDRIKEVRTSSNKSLTAFADSLGISKGTLSKMENNKNSPSVTTLVSLSKQYNVNLNWILTSEGEMYIDSSNDSEFYKEKIRYLKEKLAVLSKKLEEEVDNINEIVAE
jgi:transcriptional regulator with XRE-family HTH domain